MVFFLRIFFFFGDSFDIGALPRLDEIAKELNCIIRWQWDGAGPHCNETLVEVIKESCSRIAGETTPVRRSTKANIRKRRVSMADKAPSQ